MKNSLRVLTNIPAPYRIAAWNRLSELVGGQMEVWFMAASEPRRNWTAPHGEMRFRFRFLTHRANPSGLWFQVKIAVGALVQLVRARPQAVICGGYDSLAAWVCFLWSKLLHRRFVLWLESTARDTRHPGRVRTWLKRVFISRADGIAAAGKATVDYVKSLGASDARIFLAPMSMDTEFFARQAAQVDVEEEKRKRGFARRLILYSGRLDRKKGVFVLLQAFCRIARELPDVGLLIAGHGPERKEMEEMCACLPRVYFLGARQHRDMPYAYALADVLALPTFSDTWGVVINEAFACGVPAVVSSVAGACDDLIVDGQTGFTVNPGDSDELAGRLLQVLGDADLRLRMSANCRALIERYSPEASARGLLAAAQGAAGGADLVFRSAAFPNRAPAHQVRPTGTPTT